MDGVALASVITGGVLGVGGLGAGLWTARHTALETRRAQVRERRADAYTEVLRRVERQAFYHQRVTAKLEDRVETHPQLQGLLPTKPIPEEPPPDEVWLMRASLAGFGSTKVQALHAAWTAAVDAVAEHQDWLWFDMGESYTPDSIIPSSFLDKLRKLSDKEEAARRALGAQMAAELQADDARGKSAFWRRGRHPDG